MSMSREEMRAKLEDVLAALTDAEPSKPTDPTGNVLREIRDLQEFARNMRNGHAGVSWQWLERWGDYVQKLEAESHAT